MRKQHVHLDRDRILPVLAEVGGCACLPDVAEHFNVSEATVRRACDGLVYRGLVRVVPAERGRVPRQYVLTDAGRAALTETAGLIFGSDGTIIGWKPVSDRAFLAPLLS